MLNETTERKRIYNVTQFRESLQTIAEARPLNTVHPGILEGLFNIVSRPSTTNTQAMQRELKGVLTGTGTTRWYYIRLEKKADTPRGLKFVHFKGNKTKADPNEIHRINIDGFKYYAYAISFIKPDGNGFYFIVHLRDVIKFINEVNKANTTSRWEEESREYDFEILEDLCYAYDIKTTTDHEKIFKHLDEQERKLLYTYAKKAGVTKKERQLLKQIRKGGKPFNIYIEELEEAIEEAEDPRVEEKLKQKLLRLTEEDNSWNNFKTTIEDYL